MDVFNLSAAITLNTSEYESALDGASKKTSSFADKLKSGLGAAAKAGAAAIGAATSAVSALSAVGVSYNSQMEQYTTNFTTMLGDTEAAAQKVEELKKFAASTPLSMADLATGTQTLLAFGVASEDSTDILRQLGDIALGDADKMQRLSVAFGKANAQGKLTGETVMQMVDAGYNPLIDIAKITGESMEDLQKRMSAGKVSVDELKGAITAATSEGGKFAGGMEAASKTFAGQMSTLKDNAMSLVGEVFKPISDELAGNILPLAIESVNKISSAFQEGGLDGAISAFGGVLSDGLNMIISYLPQMVNAGMQLIGLLGQGILDNLPQIVSAAGQIVLTLADSVVFALPSIFSAGGQLLEMLVNGIVEGIPVMIERLPEVIDGFLNFITDNLPSILEKGKEMLLKLATGIIGAIPQLVSKLPQIISSFTNFITENGPKILQSGGELLGKLAIGIIGAIPDLIAQIPSVITAIVDAFKAGWELVKNAGKYLLEGLWAGISDKVEWLKGKVAGVVDTIKGWFTGEEGFDEHSPSKWANGVGEYVMEGLSNGMEAGSGGLMGTVDAILSGVKSRFDEVSNYFDAKGQVSKLEYQLWERTEGRGASDVTKYTKQLENLNGRQQDQVSVVEAAEAAYRAVVEMYGAASEESYKYQKALLEEKLALQDIMDEISQVNAARGQAVLKQAEIEWQNSALGRASAAAYESGRANPYDVAMTANINVVLPDGKVLAQAVAQPLVDYMDGNGTPIVNPGR